MTDNRYFTDDDVVFAYSRADALADGVLVDLSPLAREAGFVYPVAITAAAWTAAIEPPADCPDQSREGRMWDVLQVLRSRAREAGAASRVDFIVRVKERADAWRDVPLKALGHLGDAWEPVISILLPEED